MGDCCAKPSPATSPCGCADAAPANVGAADWTIWARIVAGAVIAGWGVVVGLAINISEAPPLERWRVHAWLAGTAGLVAIMLGPSLLRSVLRSLRERRLTIDALFLAGLLGAAGTSAMSTISGEGPVFYETIAVLLVVHALGERAREATRRRALDAADAWTQAPETCRVETEAGVRTVPVAQVAPGDIAVVPPGTVCPVDGVIKEGEALVATAALTGEAFSVRKQVGDTVEAGWAVQDGLLRIRATAPGEARRIDALVRSVQRASERPSALQTEADRLVRWFLPAVLSIAILVTIGWTIAEGWGTGLFTGMAVLLVACPCALGVAAPVAVWATLGNLARRGLVPAHGEVVERLAAVDAAIFDKTGTLTEADRADVHVRLAPGSSLSSSEALALLGGVQSCSDHPYAEALRDLGAAQAGRDAAADARVERIRPLPGRGIEAAIRTQDGAAREVRVGSAALLEDAPPAAREAWRDLTRGVNEPQDRHRLALLVDDELIASIELAERARFRAREALVELERLGVEGSIMTGDPRLDAAAGFQTPYTAGMTPEAKADRVRKMVASGRKPVFIGDGFNDAPALAEAWVAVARVDGAELSAAASDLIWTGQDASVLPWAVRRCRAAVRGVRTNLRIAATYNAIGMTIAAAGWLHPVAAAILMMCSSAVVTFRAMRLAEGHEEATPEATRKMKAAADARTTGTSSPGPQEEQKAPVLHVRAAP